LNKPNKVSYRRVIIARSSDSPKTVLVESAKTPEAHLATADADDIFDLKRAARLLGYSQSHLSKILAGKYPNLPKLRHVRVGRTVRIRRSAVLEWFYQAESSNRDSE
jgi:excisionase family DNA binding protein